MTNGKKSLRSMVEYWLAPDPSQPLRVTRLRSKRLIQECCVYIEAISAGGQVAMYLFRHQDGTWRIYPPTRERPSMCAPQ